MRSFRPTLPVVILAALALLLAACGGAATTSPTPDVTETPTAAATAEPTAEPTAEATTEPTAEPDPTETAAETDDGAAAEEVRVRIDSFAFDPSELTVAPGTTVIFLNADSFPHTVTEGTDGQAVDDAIVDEDIEQNQTVRVTFDEPGTYDITCRFHPAMQMTIVVEG